MEVTMSNKPGVLRTVTDRFSLFNDGRKLGANKRNYLIQSVKRMFESEKTKELLRLGEAVGYYGHQNRERSGKLFPGETEVLMYEGKPVVVDNVPGCSTVSVEIDEDTGIITHTQEILDTPAGLIMESLIKCKKGGWSWATSGSDTKPVAIAKTFAGFDYVLQPNYLSVDKLMLESIPTEEDQQAMLLESLGSAGFDESSISKIIQMGDEPSSMLLDRCTQLEEQVLIFESMLSDQQETEAELERVKNEKEKFFEFMLESIDASLPIYLTDEQKTAIRNFSTNSDHDKQVISLMFESLKKQDFNGLPIGKKQATTVKPSTTHHEQYHGNSVSFGQNKMFR